MSLTNPDLNQRSHAALENNILQGALKRVTTTLMSPLAQQAIAVALKSRR